MREVTSYYLKSPVARGWRFSLGPIKPFTSHFYANWKTHHHGWSNECKFQWRILTAAQCKLLGTSNQYLPLPAGPIYIIIHGLLWAGQNHSIPIYAFQFAYWLWSCHNITMYLINIYGQIFFVWMKSKSNISTFNQFMWISSVIPNCYASFCSGCLKYSKLSNFFRCVCS